MKKRWQRVLLKDIVIEAHVGITDWERTPGKRQRLLVDVDMRRPEWGVAKTVDDCIDYDRVFAHVTRIWPDRLHTDLLETLADELLEFCFQDPKVMWCRIRIRKPDVYNGRAVPMIEVARGR